MEMNNTTMAEDPSRYILFWWNEDICGTLDWIHWKGGQLCRKIRYIWLQCDYFDRTAFIFLLICIKYLTDTKDTLITTEAKQKSCRS